MPAKNKPEATREFRNSKAGRDYFLDERFEAGVVLRGTEVKAIRAGQVSLSEAFCRIEKGEAFIYSLHIAEYAFGNLNNHAPLRPRKLLLKSREIEKLRMELDAGGKALVPVRLYFKEALIKVELALATGKQQHDKRADIRERDSKRDIARSMSLRRR
jgi:SsrA-binding protein